MIHATFAPIAEKQEASSIANQIIDHGQNESLFHLNYLKNIRINNLKKFFSGREIKNIFISNHLSSFECNLDKFIVNFLKEEFYINTEKNNTKEIQIEIEGGIVILNNNDLSHPNNRAAFSKFYEECPNTIFIAWDWDNHHWLDLSIFLATHSDIYAPAHNENLYLLTRYNWITTGPVYCSSVQWSREFLTEKISSFVTKNRSNNPLGMHIQYGRFQFRNQIIATLNKKYSTIGFSSHHYHGVSKEERLDQWSTHKLHWIAPVLNDVPIRIFDALITGGIPIVPSSLRYLNPINEIPNNYVVFYTPEDILNPEPLIEKSINSFDVGGNDAVIGRHRYALENHHGDRSIQKMVECAVNLMM